VTILDNDRSLTGTWVFDKSSKSVDEGDDADFYVKYQLGSNDSAQISQGEQLTMTFAFSGDVDALDLAAITIDEKDEWSLVSSNIVDGKLVVVVEADEDFDLGSSDNDKVFKIQNVGGVTDFDTDNEQAFISLESAELSDGNAVGSGDPVFSLDVDDATSVIDINLSDIKEHDGYDDQKLSNFDDNPSRVIDIADLLSNDTSISLSFDGGDTIVTISGLDERDGDTGVRIELDKLSQSELQDVLGLDSSADATTILQTMIDKGMLNTGD